MRRLMMALTDARPERRTRKAMDLLRLHGYEVTPQRLSMTAIPPRGGAFSADETLQKSLEAFLEKSKLTTQPTVDFRVEEPRTNDPPTQDVRKLILDYTFGTPSTA